MTSEDVSVPAPGGALPSHLATPTGAGPWPGVVVLHDLVGMSRADPAGSTSSAATALSVADCGNLQRAVKVFPDVRSR